MAGKAGTGLEDACATVSFAPIDDDSGLSGFEM